MAAQGPIARSPLAAIPSSCRTMSHENRKAFDSIRVIRESDSNEIAKKDSTPENRTIEAFQQFVEWPSVEVLTMKIFLILCEFIMSLIQMKSMKGICTPENIMVQNFPQHRTNSQTQRSVTFSVWM
jgi:hypothetical protein